jgi:AraC-like DNA-binding protein
MSVMTGVRPSRRPGVSPYTFAGSSGPRLAVMLQDFAAAAMTNVRLIPVTATASLSGVMFVGACAEAYVATSSGIVTRFVGSGAAPQLLRISDAVPGEAVGSRRLWLSSDATTCEVPAGERRRSISITVPLPTLAVDLSSLDLVAGAAVDAPPIAWHSLHGLADMLAGGVEEWIVASALAIDRYLIGVASLVVASIVDSGVVGSADQNQARLRQGALALIETLFQDSSLAPATIASRLGVSLRSLHRAFEGYAGVADELRRRRVEYAAQLLSDVGLRQLPINEVARRAGFSSLATFGRSFGRTYEVSAHHYRATMLASTRSAD